MLSFTLTVAALVTAATADPSAAAQSFDVPVPPIDFASLATTTLAYAPEAIDAGIAIDGPDALASLDAIEGQDAATGATGAMGATGATTAPASELSSPATHDNRFFQRGSWRWNIQLGAGSDFGDEAFGIAGFGVSCFLEDSFTIDFELNGLYFSQSGDVDDAEADDAACVNLALLFRWHFWISEDKHWSVYADAGAGVMFSTEDVPTGGTSFNFTPQAGMGFSTLLDAERDVRLLSGFRWYHVSNANTGEHNPGLNTLMIYAGVNFPF